MRPREAMKKPTQVCFVCDSDEVNDLELGEFKTHGKISVHYFCLLLTSGLVQNGDDDEGILGFLHPDIRVEVDRIKRLKCFYCKKIKANIGCCDRKCRRTFHTSCGIRNDCLSQFEDPYKSYCHEHVSLGSDDSSRLSKRKKHTSKEMCTICYEPMGTFHQVNSVLSPCCKAHWFHKRCLMEFAKNAGYFFKCPMCNNEESFRNAVKLRGIFVPDRDAAWETEPNAFAELLEVPDTCEAIDCVCPQGRDYENTQYTLIRCDTCGSHCVHNKCLLTKEPFTCGACVLPVSEMSNPEVLCPEVLIQEDLSQEIIIKDALSEDVNIEEVLSPEETSPKSPIHEANIESAHEEETTDEQPKSGSQESNGSDTESDDYLLARPKCMIVKWNNILTPSHKRRSNDPDMANISNENNNCNNAAVAVGKNLSTTSDVEFIETKDEVMCISDDDENLASANHLAAVAHAKKRVLDESLSPPIRQPNKKVRRALQTMRNQSKITSFFSQIGKGVLGMPASSTSSPKAVGGSVVKIEATARIKTEPGLP